MLLLDRVQADYQPFPAGSPVERAIMRTIPARSVAPPLACMNTGRPELAHPVCKFSADLGDCFAEIVGNGSAAAVRIQGPAFSPRCGWFGRISFAPTSPVLDALGGGQDEEHDAQASFDPMVDRAGLLVSGPGRRAEVVTGTYRTGSSHSGRSPRMLEYARSRCADLSDRVLV